MEVKKIFETNVSISADDVLLKLKNVKDRTGNIEDINIYIPTVQKIVQGIIVENIYGENSYVEGKKITISKKDKVDQKSIYKMVEKIDENLFLNLTINIFYNLLKTKKEKKIFDSIIDNISKLTDESFDIIIEEEIDENSPLNNLIDLINKGNNFINSIIITLKKFGIKPSDILQQKINIDLENYIINVKKELMGLVLKKGNFYVEQNYQDKKIH